MSAPSPSELQAHAALRRLSKAERALVLCWYCSCGHYNAPAPAVACDCEVSDMGVEREIREGYEDEIAELKRGRVA